MPNFPRRAFARLLGAHWAIADGELEALLEIFTRERNSIEAIAGRLEVLDMQAIEAVATRLEERLDNGFGARRRGPVAIIPMNGPIFPRANLIPMLSGACSIDLTALAFNAALNADGISDIVIDMDTPGGVVNGVGEFAEMIVSQNGREIRKPVTVVTSGQITSAGYWIAAGADRIVAHPSAEVGSIGVATSISVQENPDESGNMEFIFTSSNADNKRPDPRTAEGKAVIQSRLDQIEDEFITAVADGRGVLRSDVLARFGRGQVFAGREALSRGMIDGLGSLEEILGELTSVTLETGDISGAQSASSQMEGLETMSKNDPTADAPETQDNAAGNAPAPAAGDAAATAPATAPAAPIDANAVRSEAIEGERERIAGLIAATLPGCDDLRDAMIADGTSTAGNLALAQQARGAASAEARLEAIRDDAAAIGDRGAPGATTVTGADAAPDPKALAQSAQELVAAENKAGRKLSYAEAVQRVQRGEAAA